jgi:hypothetical protein
MKLDNVVFRDGRAVGLIDFDLAGPGSRAWDVACAARLWAPLRPGVHISDIRRHRKFERFRLLVDSYGMNDSDRMKVVEGVEQNYVWFYDLIKTNAASGHTAFSELWRTKTGPRAELTRRWHAENRSNLRTALGIQPAHMRSLEHPKRNCRCCRSAGSTVRPASCMPTHLRGADRAGDLSRQDRQHEVLDWTRTSEPFPFGASECG